MQFEISAHDHLLAQCIHFHPKHTFMGVAGESESRLLLRDGSFSSPWVSSLSILLVLLRKFGKELKSSMCNCQSEAEGSCRQTPLPVFK